ncbi:MAG TPA: lipopolysaccharide transport periplasmic protein LptA [Rhizomicrobium sp.]|jgi:lipopolysaccharide export system protein LptA|nr:lipopolysaccharide transport periplasmic protein LptA [Rhizomicrobium sp.]
MKHALVFLAAFAAGAIVSGGLKAAPAKPTPAHDNKAPIDISSDSFQADLNGKTGTWNGNVILVQGDMKLRANSVRVTTVNGNADKVMAAGNVVVDSPRSGTATGDNAVYSVGPRTVVLTGNVVLKKGKDVLQGTHGTFNMATGVMALTGEKSPQNPGGRVKGVFTPNSQ